MIPEADEAEISNRIDLSIMRGYRESEDIRNFRHRLLHHWREDEAFARLSLSHMEGLSGITPQEDDRAIRNIADYWFEPLVLQTMNLGQVRDYFLAIRERMQFDAGDMPSAGQPLVLQTLHHRCIFSMLYVTVQCLIREFGFNKFVLLHLRNPLDHRLILCKALIEQVLQGEAVGIQLEGDWLGALGREMTDQTVLIYMGDMSPKMFPDQHRPGKTSSRLQLYAEPDIALEVEGISIAPLLARRFRAAHHLLDFPQVDVVCCRPWSADSVLKCSLADWVFWPALRWYREMHGTVPMAVRA